METQDRVTAVVHAPEEATPPAESSLFSRDPETAFQEAQRLVSIVARRCTGPGYLVNIRGKQYPKIEWWTTVSASLGLFPRVLYAHRLDREDEIAYEARVEVHRNGHVISSGEALCSNREARWQSADEYAIKSMAITRASGKAYRIPLSFLAVMAGLEATPAEEMPVEAAPERVRRNGPEPELIATAKQLAAIEALLDNPVVTAEEKSRIHAYLTSEPPVRSKARDILDYFYGLSEYQDGQWVKTKPGVLALR